MSELIKIQRTVNDHLIGQTIESITWCSHLDAPRYLLASGTEFSMEVHVSTVDYDLTCTMLIGDQKIIVWPPFGDSHGEKLTALESASPVSSEDTLTDCVGATITNIFVAGTGQYVDIRFELSNGRLIEYSASYSNPEMMIATA